MDWKSRLLYPQNWNIGFVELSAKDLLERQKLGRIRWMKHKYKDRWFADPFIYKVTDDEIVVFVEECMITDKPKGILCELHVDRKTMRLRKRFVLLELDTHLSYPAFIKKDGVTYVYPENGASGSLKMYRYDEKKHKLGDPIIILDGTVADSTILQNNDGYTLIATKTENPIECAYLYKSHDLFGPYQLVSKQSVQSSRSCSRPAGNWITVSGKSYRPAQNCGERYGGAVNMMEVESWNLYSEKILFPINPNSFRYNLGIHTINESPTGGLLVVDGYGYLYPVFYRFWAKLAGLKQIILGKKR